MVDWKAQPLEMCALLKQECNVHLYSVLFITWTKIDQQTLLNLCTHKLRRIPPTTNLLSMA